MTAGIQSCMFVYDQVSNEADGEICRSLLRRQLFVTLGFIQEMEVVHVSPVVRPAS